MTVDPETIQINLSDNWNCTGTEHLTTHPVKLPQSTSTITLNFNFNTSTINSNHLLITKFKELHWNCTGTALELLWNWTFDYSPGQITTINSNHLQITKFWNCTGTALESQGSSTWTCNWLTLKRFKSTCQNSWNCTGTALELLWNCSGTALELLQVAQFSAEFHCDNCLIQVRNIAIESAAAEGRTYTQTTPSSSVIISREHLNADNRRLLLFFPPSPPPTSPLPFPPPLHLFLPQSYLFVHFKLLWSISTLRNSGLSASARNYSDSVWKKNAERDVFHCGMNGFPTLSKTS